jgi:hypothetical protein
MWTKQHSKNAVAAKNRKRIERANAEPAIDRRRIASPRKAKADFIIRIEDRFGERVQVSAFRFMGRVHLSTGQSVRQFCRGLEQLLAKSA